MAVGDTGGAIKGVSVPSGYKGVSTNSIERNTSINYRNPFNVVETLKSPTDVEPYTDTGEKSIGQITTITNKPTLGTDITGIEYNMLQDHNIVNKYRSGFYDKFSRYGYIDPYNIARKTKEYLFFTKPDLHIFNGGWSLNPEIANSTFFQNAAINYHSVAYMLQNSMSSNTLPFIPMLSNAVASSLEFPGISADYIETAKNVYGTSMHYRGSSFKSDQDFDFSLDFKDGKNLDIYMFFKMYDEYERLKWLGQVSPPSDNYIVNKVLHDQFSIYKFIVGEDGMSILFFGRVVGVMPTSVPRDSIGNMEGDLTLSVSFHGKFVYDMDPRIISDFNSLTASYRSGHRVYELYNKDTKENDGRWAHCPFIHSRYTNLGTKYYLRWTI